MQEIGPVESARLPADDGAPAKFPVALQALRQIEPAPCRGLAELALGACDIDRFMGALFRLRLTLIAPVSMAQHPDLSWPEKPGTS